MTRKFGNSSSAWDRPLSVRLAASRRAGAVLVAVHGAAALAVCLAAIPTPVCAALAVAVVVAGMRNLRLHATRRARDAILELERDGAARWWIVRANGRRERIAGFSSVYLSTAAVILAIRCEDAIRSEGLVVCADATDSARFLQLRRALAR